MSVAHISKIVLDTIALEATISVTRDSGEPTDYVMDTNDCLNYWFQTPPDPTAYRGIALLLLDWLVQKGHISYDEIGDI
jgi:hypothetical protein